MSDDQLGDRVGDSDSNVTVTRWFGQAAVNNGRLSALDTHGDHGWRRRLRMIRADVKTSPIYQSITIHHNNTSAELIANTTSTGI